MDGWCTGPELMALTAGHWKFSCSSGRLKRRWTVTWLIHAEWLWPQSVRRP